MSVSVMATGDTVICKLTGKDNKVIDMLNVQQYQYQAGLAPSPGGVSVVDWSPIVFNFWANFWGVFQSNQFSWTTANVQRVKSLTAVAPDRYKAVLWDQWTHFDLVAGTVVSPSLPAYASFNIQKISAAPGRGRQGHIRISGVPENAVTNNEVNSLNLAALNAAMTPGTNLTIPFGGGFSDQLVPITTDGKLVNTAPGNIPSFYARTIDGFAAHPVLGSQITRKLGRHRS